MAVQNSEIRKDYFGHLQKSLEAAGETPSPKHLEGAANELRFIDTDQIGGNGEEFNRVVEALADNYRITPDQALEVMNKYVDLLKRQKREKAEKGQARKKAGKLLIYTLAGSVLLGGFSGGFYSIYNASRDPTVKQRLEQLASEDAKLDSKAKEIDKREKEWQQIAEKSLLARKAELEQRYLGTLASLLDTSDNSTLTALERKLYADKVIGKENLEVGPNSKLLFDQLHLASGVKIKEIINIYQKSTENWSITYWFTPEVALIREKDGKLLSVNVYQGPTENQIASMSETYAKIAPKQTLIFRGNEAIQIDYGNQRVIKFADGRPVYESQNPASLETYRISDLNMFRQFQTLESRGPNALTAELQAK